MPGPLHLPASGYEQLRLPHGKALKQSKSIAWELDLHFPLIRISLHYLNIPDHVGRLLLGPIGLRNGTSKDD